MNIIRRFVYILLLIGMIVMAGAQGVLNTPISADPEHLDPWRSTTTATREVIINVYEGLTGFHERTGAVVPLLAESWDISPDGLTYTFHLREGVLFQEAEGLTYEKPEVTASDVVWSWQRFLTEDTNISQHPEYILSVVGAQEYMDGEIDHVSGLKIIDDYTLEVTLTAPSHRFLADIINAYVVSKEAVEHFGDLLANNPVGTGPFLFERWNRDDELILTKNPNYWDEGLPKLDGVRYVNVPDRTTGLLQYRQGELDVLLAFPDGQLNAIKQEFADEYHEQSGLNVRYWGFKMDNPLFGDNLALRQAFNYAVDRELIWDILMEGSRVPGTLGVLPPDMPAADIAGYEYDPEKAAEKLAEAGYPGGEGLPPITAYYFASASDGPMIAFQDALAQIGVDIILQKEDNTTYWTHIGEEDVDLFLSGWSADYADPSEVFDYLFADGRDDTAYNNPTVNDLLAQARATSDDAEREAIYLEAHEIIMADAPWVVSGYSIISYLTKPYVNDYIVSAAGTYRAPLKLVSLDR